MTFTHSLAGRLSAQLIFLITLIFSVTTVIDYMISRDHVLTEARLRAKEEVKDAVYSLETLLYSVQKTTDQLGVVLGYSSITPHVANRLLVDLVSTNDDLFGAAIALEPEFTIDSDVFARYVYREEQGVKQVDLTATPDSKDSYLTQDWYLKAKQAGKPVWSEPYYDEYGSQVLMVTYTVPIYQQMSPLLYQAQNTGFIGVVTADITLDSLKNFMNQIKVGESGYGFLANEQGRLLSFPDEEKILSPLLSLFSSSIERSPEVREQWRDHYAQMVSGESGVLNAPCLQTDSDCLYGYSALGSTRWPFVVVIKEDEFLAPLRDYLIRVFVLGLFTVGALLYVIYSVTRKVISPITSMSRLVGRIGEGDLSTVLPNVKHKDEVYTLVEAVSSMQSHLKKYIRSLEKETELTARLRGEMDAATKIQMAMLPGEGQFYVAGSVYEMYSLIDPAKSVGGDLYFYYRTDMDESYFVIGDVSDKGVPASLFMAKTITLLTQLVSQGKRPSDLLYELNNELEKNNDACMFVTLWCGILDHRQGVLEFASGGHMAPLLVKHSASDSITVKPLLQENGMALGLMSEMDFPANQTLLEPGDRLFLYTDGVDEAQNRQKSFYGMERLVQNLAESSRFGATDMVNSVYNSVKAFAQDTFQSDDITLMAIHLLDGDQHAMQDDGSLETKGVSNAQISDSMQLIVSAESVHKLLAWVEQFWTKHQLPKVKMFDVKLCLEELFSNVYRYSGLSDPDQVDIQLTVVEAVCQIQLMDSGHPFNPFDSHAVTTERMMKADASSSVDESGVIEESDLEGGFGIHLVTELSQTQEYQYIHGKNQVKVTLDLTVSS